MTTELFEWLPWPLFALKCLSEADYYGDCVVA